MKKFLLVIFFTMVPVLAHGGTYYVAKTGSDSNSCNSAQSQSTPKLTINTGIGCLSAGDTLIVKPGIYAEILNPDNNGMQSGTAGNPITIRSETQYGAVIQPDSSLQSQRFDGVGIVSWRDQSYIVFDGFVVDANNLPNAYLIFAAHTSHHITIVNNELRNGHDVDSTTNSDGVYIAVETHDILVGHNKIHDIGIGAVPGQGFYSYGIYWPGHNSIAEYNEIYNSSGYGIHMYNAPPGTGADNNIIRNNII